MASISYKITCYSGFDAFKAVHDVSRDDVPFQFCVGKNGFDKGLPLEDVIETLLGVEIIDELDYVEDMRAYALERWKHRRKGWVL